MPFKYLDYRIYSWGSDFTEGRIITFICLTHHNYITRLTCNDECNSRTTHISPCIQLRRHVVHGLFSNGKKIKPIPMESISTYQVRRMEVKPKVPFLITLNWKHAPLNMYGKLSTLRLAGRHKAWSLHGGRSHLGRSLCNCRQSVIVQSLGRWLTFFLKNEMIDDLHCYGRPIAWNECTKIAVKEGCSYRLMKPHKT
jgi:hypothetical protein